MRQLQIYFVIVSCLGALSLFLWNSLRQESPEGALQTLMGGIERRDARTILRYVSNEERKVLSLTERSLQEFLDKFVGPRIQGLQRSGPPSISLDEEQRLAVCSQGYVSRTGAKPVLGLTIYEADGQLYALDLVRSLYVLAAETNLPTGDRPSGRKLAAFWGTAAQENGPLLVNLGLALGGFTREDSGRRGERLEYQQWKDLADRGKHLVAVAAKE